MVRSSDNQRITRRYLTIGEFAKLSRASEKSLRYYDRIGIFSPAHIDEKTGYRYYYASQIYQLNLVRFCVENGVPTDRIRSNCSEAGILETGKFFRECLDLSRRNLRRAYAAMVRMEAYSSEYEAEITADMLSKREVSRPDMAVITCPCGDAGKPPSYNEYLASVTHCIKRADELDVISLAHQGIMRMQNGAWSAFIDLQPEPDVEVKIAGKDDVTLRTMEGGRFVVTSVVGSDVERCLELAFQSDPDLTCIEEAWAYSTTVEIPALNVMRRVP